MIYVHITTFTTLTSLMYFHIHGQYSQNIVFFSVPFFFNVIPVYYVQIDLPLPQPVNY